MIRRERRSGGRRNLLRRFWSGRMMQMRRTRVGKRLTGIRIGGMSMRRSMNRSRKRREMGFTWKRYMMTKRC